MSGAFANIQFLTPLLVIPHCSRQALENANIPGLQIGTTPGSLETIDNYFPTPLKKPTLFRPAIVTLRKQMTDTELTTALEAARFVDANIEEVVATYTRERETMWQRGDTERPLTARGSRYIIDKERGQFQSPCIINKGTHCILGNSGLLSHEIRWSTFNQFLVTQRKET